MPEKRQFYGNEALVTTTPGLNVEMGSALKEQESAHGNISFIDGMGVRTAPYLEQYTSKLRLFIHDKWSVVSAELGTQRLAFWNEWAHVKLKVDDVVAEPMFPGLVALVFPVLVTNVMVTRQILPVRFLAASAVAGLSLKYVMPRTFDNVQHKLYEWEHENFPEAVKQQNQWLEQAGNYKEQADEWTVKAKKDLQALVHRARKTVIDLLSDD